MRCTSLSIVAATLVGVATSAGSAGVTFNELGGVSTSFIATSISADGRTVAGRRALGWGSEAMIWNADSGFRNLGFALGTPPYWYRRDIVVSPDGGTLTGGSTARSSFVWSEAGGLTQVDSSSNWSLGVELSADGSAMVGFNASAGTGSFYWSHETGVTLIGRPPELDPRWTTWAYGLSHSGDQAVVACSVDATPRSRVYRWSPTTGFRDTGVETFISDANRSILAISGDGQVIACTQRSNIQAPGPVVLLREGSATQTIGMLAGDLWAEAYGANFDGAVIVGASFRIGSTRPFVWREDLGLVDLEVYLTSAGHDLNDWRLTRAMDVSADGNTIIGFGQHRVDGFWYDQSWIVTIPSPASGIAGLMVIGMLAGRPRRERSVC